MVSITLTDVPASVFDAATAAGKYVEEFVLEAALKAAESTTEVSA